MRAVRFTCPACAREHAVYAPSTVTCGCDPRTAYTLDQNGAVVMTHTDPEQPTPTIPPAARTIAYVVAIVAGAAVTPLNLAGLDVWSSVAGAAAAAGAGIAFGYRPTRTS